MEVMCSLKGLHCPNCAAKIEAELSRLPGVLKAEISVISQALTMVLAESQSKKAIFKQVEGIVHKFEPEVKVEDPELQPRQLVFALVGLTCPCCAQKISKALAKESWLFDFSLDYASKELFISSNLPSQELLAKLQKVVGAVETGLRVEPKLNLSAYEEENKKEKQALRKQGLKLLGQSLSFIVLLGGHLLAVLPPKLDLFIFLVLYLWVGHLVLQTALKNLLKGQIFDENFLMSFSSIVAILLGEYPEACAVMLFYQLGEYAQERAVAHSRRSIAKLMDIRPVVARVLRKAGEVQVDPKEVLVGEEVLVRPGEKIPLDGVIVSGAANLETSALTGESLPKSVGVNDKVYAGCINLNGDLRLKVTHPMAESTVSKVLMMVEHAQHRKAPTEKFITTFARYYTPLVLILALALAVCPPLFFGQNWAEWLRRACVFLIISCPCALVLSIPLTFFGGLGAASKQGILIKGGNYLEALAKLEVVLFDKTGTLTNGIFAVKALRPAPGLKEEDLLALAAWAGSKSLHPLSRSLRAVYPGSYPELSSFEELPGLGLKVEVCGQKIIAGNAKLLAKEGIAIPSSFESGSKLYVAKDGVYQGVVIFGDSLKENSQKTMKALRALGVSRLYMLTGDDQKIAQEVADKLELTDCYAELLPQEKMAKLEEIMPTLLPKKKLGYLGDGINDAPVLARADVGMAMGGLGSEAAIEAADVVLMNDDPLKLVTAVMIARRTKELVVQNIVLALALKVVLLGLGALGLIGLWLAVFGDVGVALLCVANAARILKEAGQQATLSSKLAEPMLAKQA